ncbi:MAG: MOSC domain-containing protein [Planctomycetes bacterium]|nr:MOSC domain-containing protein [Planctomycetota bacterium]HRV80085.1 MOSC domain-containing protein [Planctomycetota bacterium]
MLRPPGGAEGERVTPDQVEVRPGEGVLGDRWDPQVDPPGSEVSLINVHVLRSLAGVSERMALSGDNLQVDLDLSEANLPIGTELRIGSAVLVVSPEPHRPCARFHGRFGVQGARKVARANRRARRGRGVLCTVAVAGTIRVGDSIGVVRPGA